MEALLELEPQDVEHLPREDKVRLAELLKDQRRRLARDHFLNYAQYVRPDYKIAPHLEKIAAKLEAVERGEIDRLMIFLHPRAGKSLTCSIIFPAWYFGRNPRNQIIASAYGESLVSGFGARIRNIMSSPEHKEVFGLQGSLSGEAQARDHFLTQAGGVYRASGVGGAITGFGANILIIDDPVRGREDADSEVMRNKVWEWWQNDAYTRLMPGGAVLVIMTRWHEDDLSGRLLDANHGEWDILHIPAINTDGEACWPEMFDLDALGRIKRDVGHRTWQALYQGDPIPDSGNFFQKEWFHQVPRHFSPEDVSNRLITTYGCSDYAVSGGGGDWTVHVVAGVDPDDNIHILDMFRGQSTPDIWADKMIDMAIRWKTILWAEGRGGLQKAVEPYIVKRQMERQHYFAKVQIQETQSKRERAIAFQGRMASGKVFWPKNAGWYGTAETELLRFDAGKNDDIVDALSLLGQMLASMAPGRNPPKPPDQMGVLTIGDYESNHGPQITWNEVIERSKKIRRQGR